MKTNPNDLAFSQTVYKDVDTSAFPQSGLTKREYFAAMAMQGLIATCNAGEQGGYLPDEKIIAAAAVRCADALITELNKQP